MDRAFAKHWLLDPGLTFLNHGSFGACPRPVLDAQAAWRERMERDPVHFMDTELEPALDRARAEVGRFIGADPEDLAFIPNATTAINTVLSSIAPMLEEGDEILTTDHEYNATLNAARRVAAARRANVVVAAVPFPIGSPDEVIDAILSAVTRRTRLAMISHVTSATAIILPLERLIPELAARGVDTLVDGAHAPGMVPLDVARLGAAYYAGNCHKWLCGPKGSGFLHVRSDRRDRIRPLVTSHGANSPRRDRSRFRLEFDWTGTADPSAYLALPTAIEFIASLDADGWPGLMAANRALCLAGRDAIAAALGTPAMAPDEMLGAMAAVRVPDGLPPIADRSEHGDPDDTLPLDPLHSLLLERHAIQVPIYTWPPQTQPARVPLRLIRLSAQRYNELADHQRLATVLAAIATRAAASAAAESPA